MIKIKKSIIFIYLLTLLLIISPTCISGNVNIVRILPDFEIIENTYTRTFNRNILYVGGCGPNNYSKIQDAIDNASDGDIIYVFNGTYDEFIFINKSITLIGEDQDTTIITSGIRSIEINEITINNFTVKDTIEVYSGSNITISKIKVLDDNNDGVAYGIVMYAGTNNIITGNTITSIYGNNSACGLYIDNLSNSIIAENTLYNIEGYDRPAFCILGTDLSSCDVIKNSITDIQGPYIFGMMLSGSNITINENYIRNIYSEGGANCLFINGFNHAVARNTIIDVEISGGGYLIGLEESSNSIVDSNTIKNISGYTWGIDLFESNNNTIKRNDVEGTTLGIWLIDSHYNTIDNNNIRDCQQILGLPKTGIGTLITESTHNLITHNVFKNNHKDATFDFEHICNKDEPFNDYKKNRAIPDSFDRYEKDLSNTWDKNYWNRPRVRPVKITGTLTVCNYEYTDYYIITLDNYDYNPQFGRVINNPILRFLENHPHIFPILRILLGL